MRSLHGFTAVAELKLMQRSFLNLWKIFRLHGFTAVAELKQRLQTKPGS